MNETRFIPLSPLALSVLNGLPGIGQFVFSSRGDKPFGNASRSSMAITLPSGA